MGVGAIKINDISKLILHPSGASIVVG